MEKGAQSRGKQYVVLLANTKTQEFLKRIFRRTSKETFLVPYQEKYMYSFLYIILCFLRSYKVIKSKAISPGPTYLQSLHFMYGAPNQELCH